MKEFTDIDKLIGLATSLGDKYELSHRVLYIPKWRKRFVFNDKQEIEKIVFRLPHSTQVQSFSADS